MTCSSDSYHWIVPYNGQIHTLDLEASYAGDLRSWDPHCVAARGSPEIRNTPIIKKSVYICIAKSYSECESIFISIS